MDRLEEIEKKFCILDGWTITIGLDQTLDGAPYTGQCTVNSDKHMAVIYPWHTDESEPPYYVLHEILHIAFRAALIGHESEESFVQDLCTQFKERDQEIERLKNNLTRMQIVINGFEKSTTILDGKREQLKKEREWLLYHFAEMLCQALRIADDEAIEEKSRIIIKDMQQALKEK